MPKFLNNNDCCNPSTPGGGSGGDCLEDWKLAYEVACQEYNVKNALANRGEELYTNSAAWQTKLENWFDQIKETDEKAKNIVFELDFFVEQISIVCHNSLCTNKALKVLMCQVKAIFDCLYTYPNGADGLKDMIEVLKEKINCLDAADDETKAEVIACIAEFEAKVKAICECQDAVLKKLLETFKCAVLLYTAICDETSGLKKCIQDILNCFLGEAKVEEEHCAPGDAAEPPSSGGAPYPCDTADETKSTMDQPSFPLSDDAFYTKTAEQLDNAMKQTEQYKLEWTEVRKERDRILAKKTSLGEAIKAAEAAESGK